MNKDNYIQVKNSENRCVLNAEYFEFASLKEEVLSICMGHAMGNQDDFLIEDEAEEAMGDLAKSLVGREGIAMMLDEDEKPRAILNLYKVAYVRWHLDHEDLDEDGLPKPVLDVWYPNYGFRITEQDATNMYENICELTGLEP